MKKTITIVCAVAALTLVGCRQGGAGGTGNETGTNSGYNQGNSGGTGSQSGENAGGAKSLGTNNNVNLGNTNSDKNQNP